MPTFMLGSLTEQCYAMNLPQVKIPIPIHGDLKSAKAIAKEQGRTVEGNMKIRGGCKLP